MYSGESLQASDAAHAYQMRLDDLLTREADEYVAQDIERRVAAGEDVKVGLVWHGDRLAMVEVVLEADPIAT